jgi:pilus assembly protein CpaF
VIPSEAFQLALLEHLGPIRSLLDDPCVTEILIDGPDAVFAERDGELQRTSLRFANRERLLAALRCAAQYLGRPLDESQPLLCGRLPDGSRLQAMIAPVAPDGPLVALRRHAALGLTLAELASEGSLTPAIAALLSACVRAERSLLVTGGARAGKSTLLGALLRECREGERIIVVEETREIDLAPRHACHLEAAGRGPTLRDLLQSAARLRPDRIVLGEVRGPEALDLVDAMALGAGSCLSTLRAAGPEAALHQLETLCVAAGAPVPRAVLRERVASGVDVVVSVARSAGTRSVVTRVTEVAGVDPRGRRYRLRDLLRRDDRQIVETAALPEFMSCLAANGPEPPLGLSEAVIRSRPKGRRAGASVQDHGPTLPDASGPES